MTDEAELLQRLRNREKNSIDEAIQIYTPYLSTVLYHMAGNSLPKEDIEEIEVENSEKSPNIIFLQLESFFDPNLVKGISFAKLGFVLGNTVAGEFTDDFLFVAV